MTLWHGDCLDLMKNIPDGSIDMILCDLPYGKTRNAWDKEIDQSLLWPEYKRVVKKSGAIVLFGKGDFTARTIVNASNIYRYSWVWEKGNATGHLNAKKMPMQAHEDIMVFYKSKGVYNPQMTHGHERKVSSGNKGGGNYGTTQMSNYDSTSRYPRSVLRFKSDKQISKLHRTQKPVALLEYLIRTYTNPGDIVLDNAMGSGSTGEACINTGRSFIGIEKFEHIFKTAQKRLHEIH